MPAGPTGQQVATAGRLHFHRAVGRFMGLAAHGSMPPRGGAEPMNRRTMIRHTGTGLCGLVAGMAVFGVSSENASAAVSLGTLDVAGDEYSSRTGAIADVTADVGGAWQYDLPAGKAPDRWQARLVVTDGDVTGTVGSDSGAAKYLNNSGEYRVQGSLLDTEVYSASDLEPPSDGKMRTVTVGLGVVFEVTNAAGELLASATLSDSAEVQITDEAYTASQHGQASGSGSLTISGE